MNGNEEKLIPNKETLIKEPDITNPALSAAEAARQKRILEYKNLINGIKNVALQIINVNTELQSVQQNIQMCMTGQTVNFINGLIEEAQDGIENTINNLNAIGTRAADKITNEGEPCTYEEEHANLQSTQNTNNNQFSCNTDLLRESVLPSLQKTYGNLNGSYLNSSSFPILEGCEDVINISPEIDNMRHVINQAYQKVEEFIENIEEKEKENVGIIDGLINYASHIFFRNNEEVNQGENNPNMLGGGALLDFQNNLTETILNNEATRGLTNLHTQEGLMLMAQIVHNNQMEWRYSAMGDPYPGLQYSNFDDVLNNPNKATCCATYVSEVLYRCGFITSDDVSPFGEFNPNYPLYLNYGLREKGWERIDDINCLEPGDVVFYGSSDWNVKHVEFFAGVDENTGEYLWYSAGSNEEIQSAAPTIKEGAFAKLMSSNWWAYRPDYDEVDINYSGEESEQNINVEPNGSTNNSTINGSLLGKTNSSIEIIMDRYIVELLANKYGVETEGKTGTEVLDEIAIKHPELEQDLDSIKATINGDIRFEEETNS